MKYILSFLLLCIFANAKEIEHYHHDKVHTRLKLNIESLRFHDSLVKNDGNVYGIEIDHSQNAHHLQLYYEKTRIDTKPNVPEDLDIDKYTLKYAYSFDKRNEAIVSYIKIDDNLAAQTGKGDVFGIGYRYKQFSFIQYASVYEDFDVFQSDLKVLYKNEDSFPFILAGVAKLIHLHNKDSNDFSKNAKSNYFTVGIKFHAHINKFHLGAATFQGKRIFAVMHDGMRVQHHAMEFKQSYIAALGYSFRSNLKTTIRYEHHVATEINPYDNAVSIDNVALEIVYGF